MKQTSNQSPTEQPAQPHSVAKRALSTFIWFFIIMLMLTFLSRSASRALMAKVTIKYPGSGVIDLSIRGTGKWVPGETKTLRLKYPRRINHVFFTVGQWIEIGDSLFSYDVTTTAGGHKVSSTKIDSAKKKLRTAQSALDEAVSGLPEGSHTDSAAVQSLRDWLTTAERAVQYETFAYEQNYAIQMREGLVQSTIGGLIVKHDLVEGKTVTPNTESIQISPEGSRLELSVSAETAKALSFGDVVTLTENGKELSDTAKIIKLGLPDADGNIAVQCSVQSCDLTPILGNPQDLIIKKQSIRYDLIVPIEALRQSGADQLFVLVLDEKKTVMGTQLTVRSVNVELLCRDTNRAAVTGALSQQDRLIATSSKQLTAGDFVVIQDER
ncbi:MAG: hypothetical protein RRZ24_06255 [Clostridia bacterium]